MKPIHSIPLLERSDRIAWYFFGAWFTLATIGILSHATWTTTISYYGIWFILVNAALRLGILAGQFRTRGQRQLFWRTCLLLFILFGAVAVQLLLKR